MTGCLCEPPLSGKLGTHRECLFVAARGHIGRRTFVRDHAPKLSANIDCGRLTMQLWSICKRFPRVVADAVATVVSANRRGAVL